MGKDFIVRFIRSDGQEPEEYFYETEKEANDHIDLFLKDDSGLYKFIALYDAKQNLVLRILAFENNIVREDFKDKDVVRLRSGYRNPGEEKYLYSVTNIHEDNGHCLIICLNDEMPLHSSENVGLEMLDRVVGIEDVIQ